MEKHKKITGTSENIIATIGTSISNLQTFEEQKLLHGLKIGISISEHDDLKKLGYSETHLKDASIEFGRYLLVYGADIVYGGDLRDGGYTRQATSSGTTRTAQSISWGGKTCRSK